MKANYFTATGTILAGAAMLFVANMASAYGSHFPSNSLYGKYRDNNCDAVLSEQGHADAVVKKCTALNKRITRLRAKLQASDALIENLGAARQEAQQSGDQDAIDAANEAFDDLLQDRRAWAWKLTRLGTAPQ